MSDYIRREDAIDLINKISNLDLKAKGGICVSLANLQKADVVQVVHGRWMPQKGGDLCCSECGGYALDEPDDDFMPVSVPSKFCPNCGAKMDGEE